MILILHIRMVHRFYISENVRFRQIGLSQLRAIMELENLLFPVVSVVWKNNVAQSSGMEKLTDQKERLKACYMVMQEVNHQLFTETIQDEVMISMKEENEKEADKFLDMLDLIKVKDRHPMSLSGGQKQRAAIASAIASGRSVLFLDEPTSGLDHKHMLEVAEVLREVWDTGISVYVITHDLELIIECCTDVIHFENGTIADQYQMDAEGMEKIRKYFMQGKCCGKWSKSD